MKFEVIEDFTDLKDENHVYRAGDHYPRKGRAKKERVEELSTAQNARGVALIQAVTDGDTDGGKTDDKALEND